MWQTTQLPRLDDKFCYPVFLWVTSVQRVPSLQIASHPFGALLASFLLIRCLLEGKKILRFPREIREMEIVCPRGEFFGLWLKSASSGAVPT